MRLGRPTQPLTLTDDERETLGQWARRPKTAQALAQRARMVLECSKPTFPYWESSGSEASLNEMVVS